MYGIGIPELIILLYIFVPGSIGAWLASKKRRSKFGWFILCAILPLLIIVIIFIKPAKEVEHEKKEKKNAITGYNQKTDSDKPLFLYISSARLILLSIASMSLYEVYWIYKNWRYIKERDGLDIKPFWRGIFGIFYCHSLLRRIHENVDARAIQEPNFSAGGLATGWVILLIFANIVSRAPGIASSIIAAFIPSFLCLLPVQKYVNSVTEKRNPNQKIYGWSSGHIVCLVFGLVIWALLLIGLGAEM
jgi:amino acid permease